MKEEVNSEIQQIICKNSEMKIDYRVAVLYNIYIESGSKGIQMNDGQKYLTKFTHIYEEDIECVIEHCNEHEIVYEIEDGYIYFKNEDFEHCLEIKEE